MTVAPAAPLITSPVDAFTEATVVVLLLQVPPVVASLRCINDPPAHTVVGPVIAAGVTTTEKVIEVEQPGDTE